MKNYNKRDVIAFVKSLNKKQKQDFLKLVLQKGTKKEKLLIAKHIVNKTFPKNKEILTGGSIWSIFKKGLSKANNLRKWVQSKSIKGRTAMTIESLAGAHFMGDKHKVLSNNNKRVKKNPMTNADKFHAKLVHQSYQKAKDRVDVDGWKLDRDLSNTDHAVYVSPMGKGIELLARGTNPTNMKDMRADLNITLGRFDKDKRFKNYEKLYNEVVEKYPKANYFTSGHSLGGTQALFLANKHGLKSTVFNPGTSVAGDAKFKQMIEDPNARIILQSGDLLSSTALNHDIKNGILLGSPSLNPLNNHLMHNFTDEKEGEINYD